MAAVCTCDKCIGGILSARNARAMQDAASSAAELMRESMPEFPGGAAFHDPEVYLLDFVPPECRMEVHKQFALGFANCIDAVAYLLKQGQVPKPRLVAQLAGLVPGLDKSATFYYLEHNGKAEYALDAVLAQCETALEDEGGSAASSDALAALPECARDGQWQLLRQQIFSNSEFWPCGPYPMDDEEDGTGGGGGDGWVHYDTSNWKPPAGR